MIINNVTLIPRGDVSKFAWSHLRRFHNLRFVAEAIKHLQGVPAGHEANLRKQAEQIRYCLQQAEEYSEAARVVSLATRPTLLYYSTMCLALAEILMKQSGDSSLDKARAEHRHHGLSLTVGSLKRDETALDTVSVSLRAVPMERDGSRIGTFALWHLSARELPIPGIFQARNTKAGRVVLSANDQVLPVIPPSGITLWDCLKCIPALMRLLTMYDVQSDIVRGRADIRIEQDTAHVTVAFHPSPLSVWTECYKRIAIQSKDVECISANEFDNFCTMHLTVPIGHLIDVRMPSSTAVGLNELRFWALDPSLNEFGFYYVALFILGTYARYYPDKWIRDIERAAPLAHVVEELIASAHDRVPLLALSELGRQFYVPGELS